MLSFLLICLTYVTAEMMGANLASSATYTKCEGVVKVPQWDGIETYQCKANEPLSGEWCCNQCNNVQACPPKDTKCECVVVAPKPEVMCPGDFPICSKSDGTCASHVPGTNTKDLGQPCTKDFKKVMCPSNFPFCYTKDQSGDCVMQKCANGAKAGTTCPNWSLNTKTNHGNYIYLGQACDQHYVPRVYEKHDKKNLDSEKLRGSADSADPAMLEKPNLTDLEACYPGELDWAIMVDYCQNECEKRYECGGFSLYQDKNGKYHIMLKRINLPDGSSVFEHKEEYLRLRDGFTTYYVQTPNPSGHMTRELFA